MDDEWPMSDVRIMWCGALSQDDAVQSMAIADDHDKDLRIWKYGTGHVRATSSRMASCGCMVVAASKEI